MAIKIYCDSCGEDAQDKEFMFDAESREALQVFDMNTQNLNPVPRVQNRKFQLCRKCYKDKFLKFLKEE